MRRVERDSRARRPEANVPRRGRGKKERDTDRRALKSNVGTGAGSGDAKRGERARVHVDDGELDRAIKMMSSTDALCSRVAAPPTVHGLALRVLADAYVRKAERASERGEKGGGDVASGESGGGEGVASGESGGGEGEDAGEEIDYLARAKGALNKGIEVCKVHEGRAGMPSFMAADLAGRMGDLYAALGEIFREEKITRMRFEVFAWG